MNFNVMDGLSALGGGVVGYIVPFLFVLTIVVFFHELGHFLIARLCGVRVLTFSVGFGPELLGFTDRYGTRWKIAAFPLGGYVKFFGDEKPFRKGRSLANLFNGQIFAPWQSSSYPLDFTHFFSSAPDTSSLRRLLFGELHTLSVRKRCYALVP